MLLPSTSGSGLQDDCGLPAVEGPESWTAGHRLFPAASSGFFASPLARLTLEVFSDAASAKRLMASGKIAQEAARIDLFAGYCRPVRHYATETDDSDAERPGGGAVSLTAARADWPRWRPIWSRNTRHKPSSMASLTPLLGMAPP